MQILIQLALARLLLPEQFGLVAIASVFINICNGIMDVGLSQAIIQRVNVSDRELSATFWINIAFGAILGLGIIVSSDSIAEFYGNERLALALKVLSLTIVIDAASRVHLSLLQKTLDFKSIMAASMPSIMVGGAVGIGAAVKGGGVWALLLQMLSQRLVQTVLLWSKNRWRPSLRLSLRGASSLLPFGLSIALTNLINQIVSNLSALFIGKLHGPSELAYYQQGDNVRSIVAGNLSAVVTRVTFPLYSSIQADRKKLTHVLSSSTETLAFVALPIMGVLAGGAESLVPALLGEQWIKSVPYVQIMCFLGGVNALSVLSLNVVASQGLGQDYINLEIKKKIVFVVALVIASKIGMMAIALATLISGIMGYLINIKTCARHVNISATGQLRLVVRPALLAVGCTLVAYFITGTASFGVLGNAALSLGAGAVCYSMGLRFFRNRLRFVAEVI